MTTIADLWARCPTCYRDKEVRLQGKTWRIVAHSQSERSRWGSARTVACPVRGVDAGPLIEAWIATIATAHEKEAAMFRSRADAQDEHAAKERARHADLTLAFRGTK